MFVGRNGQSTVSINTSCNRTKDCDASTREIKVSQCCRGYSLHEICAVIAKRELYSVCQRKYLGFLSAISRNWTHVTLNCFLPWRSLRRYKIEWNIHRTAGRT